MDDTVHIRTLDGGVATIGHQDLQALGRSLRGAILPPGHAGYWKALYLHEVTDEVVGVLAHEGRRRPSPLSSLDLWFLDGAVQRVPADATAFARRSAPYLVAFEANWDDPARTPDNLAWARAGCRRLEHEGRSEAYLNFPGFADDAGDLLRSAYGDNLGRLRALKLRYDPDNLFRGNFNIPPAPRERSPVPADRSSAPPP